MHFPSMHPLTAAVPSPPRNVQFNVTSPGTITVTWTVLLSDNSGAVDRYEVTLKRGAVTEQTMSSTSESTSFTGLIEGVVYTVEIVAVSVVGSSSAATDTINLSGMLQCKSSFTELVDTSYTVKLSLLLSLQSPLHLVV